MNNDEFDLIQALKIAWKKRNILLSILVISIVLGIIYSFVLRTPIYKSTSKILIDKGDASISTFVCSYDIAVEVAKSLNLDGNYIDKNAKISFTPSTKIIAISATSENNEESYNIVKKYEEILKTKLESVYGVKTYNIIEQAQVSNSAHNVNHLKDLIMFFVVGIIICGVYCIFLVTFSGVSIYSSISNSGITLLGKIDKENKAKSKVKSYISKNDKVIAQMKKIMTNIQLNRKVSRPKTILVTSTNYGTGTTYVTSNLAMRYSRSDQKVLIIDSNFNTGIQHKIFNINLEEGLSDLIEADTISQEGLSKVIKQSPISNLYVLPCGEGQIDEELLITDKIEKIINLAKNQFDVIIIDGEPILKQITSYGWANIVNAVVIVAEFSKTKIEDIMKAKNIIEDIDGKISGVIVNKAE